MMVSGAVGVLVVLVPVLYAGLVVFYGVSFFGGKPGPRTRGTLLVAVTTGVHLLYLVLRTAEFDHPPITTVFELMTLLAFGIAVAYWYLEMRTGVQATGFFVLLLAFLFQAVSSLCIRDLSSIPPVLRSRLLGVHVASALLGYTAISLSAVHGLLYLLLYHQIKSTRWGLIYRRLPNLETLEKLSHKAEAFGFLMLTLAIVVGLVWLPRAFESFSYGDPKLVGTLVIWLLYAGALLAKRRLGWRGRKTMILSLVGFGFVFLSMTVINVFMKTFHDFS
ncbi:MAG: cytochrome c biogenesis protein CcsA [Bacteroidota bacterium]